MINNPVFIMILLPGMKYYTRLLQLVMTLSNCTVAVLLTNDVGFSEEQMSQLLPMVHLIALLPKFRELVPLAERKEAPELNPR